MQASTARSRDLALKRYAAWLVDEGELSANPLLKPPKAGAGKGYGYFAPNTGLKARAKAAGVDGFHPVASGPGSQGGLMSVAEFRTLALGDL